MSNGGSREGPVAAYSVASSNRSATHSIRRFIKTKPNTDHRVFQETWSFVKQKKGGKKHTQDKKTSLGGSFHFVSTFYLPGHLVPTHTLDKKISCFASFCHCGCVLRGQCEAKFRAFSKLTLAATACLQMSWKLGSGLRPPEWVT